MIVYRRQLTEDDISQLKKDEQFIYYYNNNIAFTVNNNVGEYVLRKRLIYDDKLLEEHSVRTIAQVMKIIKKGKIITEGTPLDLKNKYAKDIINIYHIEEHDVMKLKLPYTKIRDGFKIEVENTSIATDLIIKNKEIFKDYEIIKGKMDDVLLNATGSNLEV